MAASFYAFARRGRRIYRVDKCLITSRRRVPRSFKLKGGIVNLDHRKVRGQGRRTDLLPRLPSLLPACQRQCGTGRLQHSRYRTIKGYSQRCLLAEASLRKPGRLPYPIWLEYLHKDDEASPLQDMIDLGSRNRAGWIKGPQSQYQAGSASCSAVIKGAIRSWQMFKDEFPQEQREGHSGLSFSAHIASLGASTNLYLQLLLMR